MEAEVIDVKTSHPTIEQVNTHLLDKLDELIQAVDAKSDPDMVKVLTESVAKLNASLKGNDIFAPRETEEEKLERQARETIIGVMGQ